MVANAMNRSTKLWFVPSAAGPDSVNAVFSTAVVRQQLGECPRPKSLPCISNETMSSAFRWRGDNFCPSSWQCVGNVLGGQTAFRSHFSRKPAFGQTVRLLYGGSDARCNRFSARFHGCKSMSQWGRTSWNGAKKKHKRLKI